MKVYEAVFDEGKSEGVYALSVVENPAMEDMWIALSEHPQKVELATVDEEKRLLLGAALIPNKRIYRNIDGNEFYITFSENTIEKLAHTFFKNQHNNNSSLEHEVKLNGMSVVEGWIVQDPSNDKSNAYGKTYEKGTWVTMMKVDNDDVWQKVKKGEVKGFSIDALLSLKPLELSKNLKTEIEMTEEVQKSIVDKVIDGVKALFNTDVEKKTETIAEEVQVQEVQTEEVQEPVFDAEKFANDLRDKFSLEFKSELEKALSAKDTEINELKAKLAKQPETEEVKVKDNVDKRQPVQLTAQTPKGRILETLKQIK